MMTVALALSAMSYSAIAADSLGKAVIINPITIEGYLTPYDTTFELEWQKGDGEAYELTLADNPTVSVLLNGKNYNVTVEAGGENTGGWMPWDLQADDEEESPVTFVRFDISDALYQAAQDIDENLYEYSGDVAITIPAGLVSSSGMKNESQTLKYIKALQVGKVSQTPVEQADITYTPQQLSNVVVSFDGELTYIGGTIEIDGVESDLNVKLEGKSLIFDLSFLENGGHNVQVPTGYVTVGDKYTVNETLYIYYNVFDGLPTAEILMGPGQYVAQGFIPNVELTWDYTQVSLKGDKLGATLTIMDGPADEWGYPSANEIPVETFILATIDKPSDENGTPEIGLNTRDNETGNVILIELFSLIPADYTGSATLDIPEGVVVDADGNVNPPTTIYFSIYPYEWADAEIEIEDNMIYVGWEGYEVSSPAIPFFITNSAGDRTELSMAELDWVTFQYVGEVSITDDYTQFEINLEGLELADGNYTLWIPGESVALNIWTEDGLESKINKEDYFNFNVTDGELSEGWNENGSIHGVESEGAETLNGFIYNIKGIKVANDANNLPSGLYIVNGKKILVK